MQTSTFVIFISKAYKNYEDMGVWGRLSPPKKENNQKKKITKKVFLTFMNVQDIIHLRKYISVLDHKDGKISLQVALKALTDPAILELVSENKNKSMPAAIKKTSIQKLARIIHIEYDTNLIEPSELETILTTRNRAQFNQLTEKYLKVLTV